MKKKRKKFNPREVQRDYLSKIEDDLERQGVLFFDEKHVDIDEDYLRLPRELTEISSRDLGEYLNANTQQKVYMRTLLGRLEIVEEQAKMRYFELANRKYSELAEKRLSETAKDRIINADEDILPLYEEYMEAKRKVSTVDIAIQNVDDVCFLLSREVTRRNGDIDSEMRASNVRYRH